MNADRSLSADAGSDRDTALRLALSHAPDRDLCAPAAVRQALQQAARQAAAEARALSPAPDTLPASVPGAVAVPASITSRLRRVGATLLSWLALGLRPPALGGLASVAVAGLALHLWMAREGPLPSGALEPAAPTTTAAAVPPTDPAPVAEVTTAGTEGAPSERPPRAVVDAARVVIPRRPGPAAGQVDTTPKSSEASPPGLATAPPLPAAAPAIAPAAAAPPQSPVAATSPAPVADPAGQASPPSGPALAKVAPALVGTRTEPATPSRAPPAPESTAPRVAAAAAPAADRGRAEAAPAAEAQATAPLGRALNGLTAAQPALRTGATPPPLERLAEALRDPAGSAAGWTVAEAGGAARPMDDATRAWWRQVIRTSAGRWVALAPDAASAAVAGAAGGEAWTVMAPDGSRFTLRQTPGQWLLIPASGTDAGAGGSRPWRASRPGSGDRAASTAP